MRDRSVNCHWFAPSCAGACAGQGARAGCRPMAAGTPGAQLRLGADFSAPWRTARPAGERSAAALGFDADELQVPIGLKAPLRRAAAAIRRGMFAANRGQAAGAGRATAQVRRGDAVIE